MKKILIAEDNIINFLLFCRILDDLEVEIIHAVNGIEAVKICELNPDITLVLMDINMPMLNGEDAGVQIKKMNPNITIVSHTAYSIMGTIKDENKEYFSEIISKPFDIKDLKKMVVKYCFGEK